MAHTLAYVAIQDLTFTETQDGLGVTIVYKNTGTAGAETVTVSDSRVITVALQSGTSTATQVKAAVDANPAAHALVTVSITGTAGTAQKSAVTATMAGGAAAVFATKSFGGLTLTALASGTDGNSIRFKYVTGTLDVTTSSNDITITFPVDTHASTIAAAVNADVEANLLVKAEGTPTDTPRLAMASSFTALAGGAAAVAASVVVQDLTFSADVTGTASNGVTVTYVNDGTAGAETVAVSNGAITVHMQSGTSTATQINTAVTASDAFNGAKATAGVTIVDYTKCHLTKASGTITVANFAQLHLTKASGTITVTNFALLHKTKALVAIQDLTYTAVAFGTAGNAYTVQYVDGGAIGNHAVVEMIGNLIVVSMDPTAVTGTSATTIKNAVNADSEASLVVLVTGAAATVQTVQSVTPLVGGINASTVTANGTVLTESVDFNAVTSNNQTATNIAAAIDAVALLDATATTNVVTIVAATAGTAGNALTLATSDATNLAKSGTTLAGGIAASTVTANGTVLTESTDFNAVTSNNQTATNIAAAIDAVALLDATATSAVVTIVAATAGTGGNALTLATSDASNLAKSGTTLAGGINALVITVNGTAVTETADFNATGSNNTTATNLATAIDALSGYDATATSAVVTATYTTRGTSGNAKTITTSSTAGATVSGATFSGGTDAYAVSTTGTGSTAQVTVNGTATASGVGLGGDNYYKSQADIALTSSFVAQTWNFASKVFTIVNDETSGAKQVSVSFDGTNTAYVLSFGETLTVDGSVNKNGVYLKYISAAPAYRLMVIG